MVTDFLMFLKLLCLEHIQMKLLEFQTWKSMIFTIEIKINYFTLSSVKSKRIEQHVCLMALDHIFAELSTGHHFFFYWIIWRQSKKTCQTLNLTKIVFGPWNWNLGLKTGIWGEGGGRGEEKGEGKISPMCESIGQRPLRGRCPKSD